MGLLRWLRQRFRLAAGFASPADPLTPRQDPPDSEDGWDPDLDEPLVYPLSDTLDLHAFAPREAASAVREFLDAACAAGYRRVRIIHGKGIGVQRAMVRRILQDDPRVVAFGDAVDPAGWGATVARLEGPPELDDESPSNP